MSNRKDCCDKNYLCINHNSWYCDECIENNNMVSYFKSAYTSKCINEICVYNGYGLCTVNKEVENEGINCEDIAIPF